MKIINKPIDIAIIQDEKGITTPIKFRFEDDEQKISVKIEKILFMDKIRDPFVSSRHCLVYRCKSVIQNVQREFELKFDIETCKWYLYKI